MSLKIRKATKKDLKEITKIFKEGTAKKPYNKKWTEKETDKLVRKLFKDNDIRVALVEEKIVGFIASHARDNKKSAYVEELWLEPKHHGKGVGKALMKFVEDKYRKKGIGKLDLIANQKAKAVSFYKKLGYKEEDLFVRMARKLK